MAISGRQFNRYPSPLRYPGGKGKVANFLKLVIIENDMLGVNYAEPYAGGASVALSLLYEDYVEQIHINDLNTGVYSFWHSALYQTNGLCRLIEETPVTIDEWIHQKEIYESDDPDTLSLGFATFYLNRTNRSGIIGGGGAIGGMDQAGPYKIDARYNKVELVRRVQKVGRFRSRITLTQTDSAELLTMWQSNDVDTTLIYLDPPYYGKGERLYDNFYKHSDHVEIAEIAARLRHPWIVSYDATPVIANLYSDVPSISYTLGYSAAGSTSGSEMMFWSPGLTIPSITPGSVSATRLERTRRTMLA